jgi:hypothetical protein
VRTENLIRVDAVMDQLKSRIFVASTLPLARLCKKPTAFVAAASPARFTPRRRAGRKGNDQTNAIGRPGEPVAPLIFNSGNARQYRAVEAHYHGSGEDIRGIQFFRGLCLALLVLSLCIGAMIMLAIVFASPH